MSEWVGLGGVGEAEREKAKMIDPLAGWCVCEKMGDQLNKINK